MSSLAEREQQLLLQIARSALTLGVEKNLPLRDWPNEEFLRRPGGAFVTLHRRGRLRGCVGQLPGQEALGAVVAHCARASALDDPRFDPVAATELSEIEIELSILSPLENVTLQQIEAGKHGLVVSQGRQRGVLLPQVAREFKWAARRFLEETCVKAGLERDAWQDPATRVQAFTAEVFSEAGPPAGGVRPAQTQTQRG
ncbi:MAG: AmmeMemoRadiSam system protein A [Candidatus Acidiferrales bacterium]